MLGTFKPVAFDPYARRRPRRRLPRWLLLLLAGTAAGAGGVLLVQDRFLPPRLSAQESAQLRMSFEQAESERSRLAGDLTRTVGRLQASLTQSKGLEEQLAAARATIEQLRADVASLVAALPPDPRGGTVEVRAARFTVEGGQLAYDVVLSRARVGGKPLSGVMQLVLSGESQRGADDTVRLEAVPVSVGLHDALRGKVALPEGFTPRQATIQVLDREGGKRLGMRVINVK